MGVIETELNITPTIRNIRIVMFICAFSFIAPNSATNAIKFEMSPANIIVVPELPAF
jgi:hypothetical protein